MAGWATWASFVALGVVALWTGTAQADPLHSENNKARDGQFFAIGANVGLLRITDGEDIYPRVAVPLRGRLLPVGIELNLEANREDFTTTDAAASLGTRDLFSINYAGIIYPLAPETLIQIYGLGGAQMFYSDTVECPQCQRLPENGWGNGFFIGGGLEIPLYDTWLVDMEARYFWVNDDVSGISNRQGGQIGLSVLLLP
ncbi:MAG: hypothetical protein HYV63_15910 [Candidatus Schekmanbacteria bacterium]|nr:hypothetical protein [Candidatus Schekmanbacteria bacterium]